MPKPGFASITIRAPVKKRLEEYAKTHGFATLSDAILALLDHAETTEKLSAIEEKLAELETLQRKTYLALLRLIEELAAQREEEGPESPRAQGDGEVGLSRSVRKVSSTDPEPAGREPRENIE